MSDVNLDQITVRELNRQLHALTAKSDDLSWRVHNPRGKHAIAAGINAPLDVVIDGHVGYYCAGMHKLGELVVNGSAGPGVAENIMSGRVRVKGNASQYAGASGHGGILVIEGDASSRCGISMKGVDIVVGGSAGHMSAFMAQKGRLVICGDVGRNFGDSIYEAILYVGGKVQSLGADCIEKEMTPEHASSLKALLEAAGMDADLEEFRRYGSARKLYHFNVDHADEY